MAKYRKEFKLMLVNEYIEGKLSYRSLAEKYKIPPSTLSDWVKIYRHFGAHQLANQQQDEKSYPIQFKLDVLHYMKRNSASVSNAALQFGIKNPSLISRWRKEFQEGNFEALNKRKGLPPMSDKAKKRKDKQQNNIETPSVKQLERENELLRLEVAYLKKLRAFQMDPEGYLEKHKQRYQPNSKKNSN